MISYTLTDEDKLAAKKCSEDWWANSKRGEYGRGVLSNGKAVNVGVMGEIAFANSFDLVPDLGYKRGGGKTDFRLGGLKIDIKTASYFRDSGLVLCYNESGNKVKLSSDIYVFGYYDTVDTINLVGFLPVSQLEHCPIEQGVGNWYNYRVPYDILTPIEQLEEYVLLHEKKVSV